MNLVFPFKNISTNSLLNFIKDRENIRDFILTEKDEYPYSESFFQGRIDRYKKNLPDFENEILQIINTTSQETIDFFFDELYDNLAYLKEQSTLDSIISKVKEWNSSSLDSFNKKIEVETDNYFKSDNRKRKHLEEYEEYEFTGFGLGSYYGIGTTPTSSKVKKINYNFYCIESEPDLLDISFCEQYHKFINDLKVPYLDIVKKYFIPYEKGEIKSKLSQIVFSKPVVFVEGEHDISYITRAAELLGKDDILKQIEIRQRGGCSNLDKIWSIYRDNNWETIRQKKLLLYDCDTHKKNEESGDVFKRIVDSVPENLISRGIENLIPNDLVQRIIKEKPSFIDITHIHRVKRGIVIEETIYSVNEDEKKNLCTWVCENGNKEDFKSFQIVFDLIQLVL